MLLELAIGDAYGAGFEFASPAHIEQHNTLQSYVKHPSHEGLWPGRYTDDTQMSIAVAEWLIENDLTDAAAAESFVKAYRRDRRKGYSRGFQSVLDDPQCLCGADLFRAIDRHGRTEKVGGAMRAVPCGLLPTISRATRAAATQASVTHCGDGIKAAMLVAAAAHYAHYGLGNREKVLSYAMDVVGLRPSDVMSGSAGLMLTWHALRAIVMAPSLSQILRTVVAEGGDTDTAAAISVGVASMLDGIEKDLPETLVLNLENGPYGRGYLVALDAQLRTSF